MDERTWQMKLAARKKRRVYERIVLIIVLFLILIGGVVHYAGRSDTPEYAMQEMIDAYRNNDADTFRRHIDLSSIALKAYDDLINNLFKYDTQLTSSEKSLAENFYVLIRRQICEGVVKVINTYLETKQWTLPEEMLKGRQLGIDYDILLERSLIRHTSLNNLVNVESSDDEVSATFNIVEEYTQIPFELKVTLKKVPSDPYIIGGSEFEIFGHKMRTPRFTFKRDDSVWKIVSVDNYSEYLDAVSPVLRKNLSSYIDDTEEIIYYYNGELAVQENHFIAIQKSPSGILLANQRTEIADYIKSRIIPTLEARQEELDQIPVPQGAQFLAALRQESTRITISAWQSYMQGIIANSSVDLDMAESLHKQEMVIEQRIYDIVNNSAVAKSLPELP